MLAAPNSTPYDWRFRLLGIPVRVSAWFWLMVVVTSGATLHSGLAPMVYWAVALLVSILAHEFGHALAARRFGMQNLRVTLYHLGGLAHYRGRPTRWQRVLIALAGPGAGFALAAVAFAAALAAQVPGTPVAVSATLGRIMLISGIWGAVNLAPVYPLDGSVWLEWLCVRRWGRFSGVIRARWIAFVSACAIAVLGLGMWLLGLPLALVLRRAGASDSLVYLVAGLRGLGLNLLLFFGIFASLNWQLTRPQVVDGAFDQGEEPREPWQQDPDGWKR